MSRDIADLKLKGSPVEMKRSLTFPDCWSDDRRMKVLFSPLRQRNVNPENYDGLILFWRNQITNYSHTQENPRVTLTGLREAFMRNGEKPHCLQQVLASMVSSGEIKPTEQFLQDANTSGWAAWSMRMLKTPLQMGSKMVRETLFNSPQKAVAETSYVVLEVVNSQAEAVIKSLKNQIVSKSDVKKRLSEWNIAHDALPLVLHELQCRQKLVTGRLDCEDDPPAAMSSDEDERTVLKFGTESHKAFEFTEIELSIHKLEFTERNLLRMIGRMEEQVDEHEEAAKKFLGEKKRVLAKNSLRKRDSLMSRMKKRVQCLENVQALVHRIHEVTDDATVLDAYRTGTKSLQMALDKSGITLDTVDDAIAKMQDVIELHDEIKNAISTVPGAGGTIDDDAELDKELEALIAGEGKGKTSEPQMNNEQIVDERGNEDALMLQLENLTIVSDPLPILVKKEQEIVAAQCL